MTTASELFYNRRSRANRNDTEELSLFSSSSNHHHRRRYQPQHHYHHQFRDIDECDLGIRRSSSAVRHFSNREHESTTQVNSGTNQTGAGSIRPTTSFHARASRLQFAHNDRLPGAVLLARERLVERLRGVCLSGNRQGSRSRSDGSWNEGIYNDESIELAGEASITPSFTQADLLSFIHASTLKKKPAGLGQEEVNRLEHDIYNMTEKSEECGICLEAYSEGDCLICLPCNHKFHSACLNPWVQICGDCPFCRKEIVIPDNV